MWPELSDLDLANPTNRTTQLNRRGGLRGRDKAVHSTVVVILDTFHRLCVDAAQIAIKAGRTTVVAITADSH